SPLPQPGQRGRGRLSLPLDRRCASLRDGRLVLRSRRRRRLEGRPPHPHPTATIHPCNNCPLIRQQDGKSFVLRQTLFTRLSYFVVIVGVLSRARLIGVKHERWPAP